MNAGQEPRPFASEGWLELTKRAVDDLDPTSKRLGMLGEGAQSGYDGPYGKKLVTQIRSGQPAYR